MATVVVIVGVLGLAAVAALLVFQKLVYICQPNEVLIFAGGKRELGERTVGYRLVQGGRGVRIPLLERVHRLDLTNMIIDLRVEGAYSKGGIPLNVGGVANVKVASDQPTIGNAIERFLGKSRAEIMQVARETLEGNLRGVLATLTPEEVNQDRVKFATSLLHEADTDLKRLGLVLDTLKIQHVSDDKGYLDSLGRKQSADLLMRSRVAEAENRVLAAERAAKNFEEKELVRLDAQIEMAKAEAQRRIVDAQTRKQAMIAEQQSVVASAVAKASAELDVQRARIAQVQLGLLADRVRPAEAFREQRIAEARGKAAKIVEEGKATAESLREVARTWAAAGEDGSRLIVAQKLGSLVDQMMETVQKQPIDRVTVLSPRLGEGGGLAGKAVVANETLKQTLGIDAAAAIRRLGAE